MQELLLHNGNIDIRPGGKLSILEGGVLRLMQGKTFEAPIGAIVEIEEGSIEPFLTEMLCGIDNNSYFCNIK